MQITYTFEANAQTLVLIKMRHASSIMRNTDCSQRVLRDAMLNVHTILFVEGQSSVTFECGFVVCYIYDTQYKTIFFFKSGMCNFELKEKSFRTQESNQRFNNFMIIPELHSLLCLKIFRKPIQQLIQFSLNKQKYCSSLGENKMTTGQFQTLIEQIKNKTLIRSRQFEIEELCLIPIVFCISARSVKINRVHKNFYFFPFPLRGRS